MSEQTIPELLREAWEAANPALGVSIDYPRRAGKNKIMYDYLYGFRRPGLHGFGHSVGFDPTPKRESKVTSIERTEVRLKGTPTSGLVARSALCTLDDLREFVDESTDLGIDGKTKVLRDGHGLLVEEVEE